MEDTPLLHKVPKAAKRIDVATSTLWALIKANEIKVVKFGGNTRVPESEIVRFIDRKIGR